VIETPLRILLAEDDDRLADLVGTILNGDGRFIVLGRATTGDDAVALCEEHEPDIVLMDIGIPGRGRSTPAPTNTVMSRGPRTRAPSVTCTRMR